MLVAQQDTNKKVMVIEGIIPLAIDVGNKLELSNANKVDMDDEYLEENIK